MPISSMKMIRCEVPDMERACANGDSLPICNSPKLTQEMADEIRRLRNLGMMQHHIAAYFGVNQGRVS